MRNFIKIFLYPQAFFVLAFILFFLPSSEMYGQTKAQSIMFSYSSIHPSFKYDTAWKADRGDIRLRRAGCIVGASGLGLIGAGIPLFLAVTENPVSGQFLGIFLSGAMIFSGSVMTLGGTSMFVVGQCKISRDRKRQLSMQISPAAASFVYRF
jgi:hypothetical protein